MITRILAATALSLVIGASSWTQAMAAVDPYSIVIKDSGGTPIGSGGLSFDNSKEVAGQPVGTEQEEAPEASPAPSITLTTGLPVVWLPFTFNTLGTTNPMKVVVVTNNLCKPGDRGSNPAVIEGLEQGPNVEGLRYRITGTKTITTSTGGTATRTYALDFKLNKTATNCPDGKVSYDFTNGRDYDLKRIFDDGTESVVASGRHHIWNPKSASPIPEPSSLALLLAGVLAALLIARVRRTT